MIASRVIDRFLYIPDGQRNRLSVIVWWESRRIPYNLLLLVLGLTSLMLFEFFSGLKTTSQDTGIESGIPIILFALGANVGYTLGWIIELAAGGMIDHTKFGPRMFIRGTVFSLILCTVPAVAAILMWAWRVLLS